MKKIIFALVVTCFVAIGCKNEAKDTKSVTKAENIATTSFKVSGMTCEIGCAKSIASKLSKLDGVVEANVIFADSIANVKFDKTKTDVTKLMTYVDGMANNMYKATQISPKDCKCEGCKGKTACNPACKKECSKTKKENKASATKCVKECCKDKSEKNSASISNCKKPCCEKA